MAFVLITIITFLGFLDTTLLVPVMSTYATGIGASVGLSGLVIGLYSITNTPASVFFGRVIDRVGYKMPLILGLAADAGFLFLYGLTGSPLQLASVRAAHGISGGIAGPATMAAISGLGSAGGRAKVMSTYGMALAFGNLVGFAASGIIVTRFSYQALFWAASGLVLMAAALSTMLPRPHKLLAPASPRHSHVSIRGLLRKRPLLASYASIFAQYFTLGSVVTLLPLYARSLGLEPVHTGMILAAFTVTFIIVQFPSGSISDRIGRLPPIVAALVLGTLALVALPFLKTFALLAGAMALYGISYGLLFPSVSALVADHTEPHERGTGMGIFHAMLTAGVAIGAPVMGWVGERIGLDKGLLATPVVLVAALVLAVWALKKRQ